MFEIEPLALAPTLIAGCSGCLLGGYLTHELARAIVSDGFAEPLCLATIGAGYAGDIESAKTAADVIVIDGYHKACARKMLEKKVGPLVHVFVLTDKEIQQGADVAQEHGDGFVNLKRDIKIQFAQNRMRMRSMCSCGCVRT
jgi:uncharacterized metal-binding protein